MSDFRLKGRNHKQLKRSNFKLCLQNSTPFTARSLNINGHESVRRGTQFHRARETSVRRNTPVETGQEDLSSWWTPHSRRSILQPLLSMGSYISNQRNQDIHELLSASLSTTQIFGEGRSTDGLTVLVTNSCPGYTCLKPTGSLR